jgi:hypothetical protein
VTNPHLVRTQRWTRASAPPAELRGRALLLARVVWVGVALLTAIFFISSIPHYLSAAHDACHAEPCVAGQLSPADVRILQELGISVDVYAAYILTLDLLLALGFCLIGTLVFLRKPRDRGALFVSFALVVFGLTWPDTFHVARTNLTWGGVAGFLTQLGLSSMLVLFFVFPDGRFVPRWTRWVAALAFLLPVLDVLFPESYLVDPPQPINILVFLGLWVGALLAQAHRYRRVSGPVQRQQTKWVVLGFGVLVVLLVGFLLPFAVVPSLSQPGPPSLAWDLAGRTIAASFGFLLMPLSIGIAILRHRLWDIDVIINRTLVYGSLTAALALAYFGGVVVLERIFRALTGQGSTLTIVASTLAIAALFSPLRRRIQTFVDRLFYRRKYDAAKTLATFSSQLREETDLDALSSDLVEVVHRTVQPAQVSLWLRPDPKPKEGKSSALRQFGHEKQE